MAVVEVGAYEPWGELELVVVEVVRWDGPLGSEGSAVGEGGGELGEAVPAREGGLVLFLLLFL